VPLEIADDLGALGVQVYTSNCMNGSVIGQTGGGA
jgi:hypothetical protein